MFGATKLFFFNNMWQHFRLSLWHKTRYFLTIRRDIFQPCLLQQNCLFFDNTSEHFLWGCGNKTGNFLMLRHLPAVRCNKAVHLLQKYQDIFSLVCGNRTRHFLTIYKNIFVVTKLRIFNNMSRHLPAVFVATKLRIY